MFFDRNVFPHSSSGFGSQNRQQSIELTEDGTVIVRSVETGIVFRVERSYGEVEVTSDTEMSFLPYTFGKRGVFNHRDVSVVYRDGITPVTGEIVMSTDKTRSRLEKRLDYLNAADNKTTVTVVEPSS